MAKRKEKHDAKVESRQELPRTCLPVQTKLADAEKSVSVQSACEVERLGLAFAPTMHHPVGILVLTMHLSC